MSKITVIGAGSVGSTIANDLMIQGTASEIVLIDVNKQKAFGEAMDIYQGAPFCSPTIVRSGDYDAAAGSDIVIITSGLPARPGRAGWSWRRPTSTSSRTSPRRSPPLHRTRSISSSPTRSTC